MLIITGDGGREIRKGVSERKTRDTVAGLWLELGGLNQKKPSRFLMLNLAFVLGLEGLGVGGWELKGVWGGGAVADMAKVMGVRVGEGGAGVWGDLRGR